MSLKTRISKIEKKLPAKDNNNPVIVNFYCYGAEPSEEEKEIALKKTIELNPNAASLGLSFLPYGFEHTIKPPRGEKVEWDYQLGLGTLKRHVYKLTKKYKKGPPYN
ncbi:hypothetical protein ACFLXG_03190 [Chloroflexota bacterium]